MAFKMRHSKFRHVYATPLKKDQCYDNIRISKSSLDSTFCAVNPKWVAIITESAGGGAFLVLPVAKTGRVERDHPLVTGHKAAVLDVKWCPHNDDIIASASDDTSVMIWQIPEEGIVTNLEEPVVTLREHQRRCNMVEWHPTAKNILLSTGADNMLILWNCETSECLWKVELNDLCYSFSFNYDGSKIAITCKDKQIKVFNTRTSEMVVDSKAHEGSKPTQCIFLKHDQIFTTGFSRMSERQYALWDMKNMSEPKNMETIDNSNGVIFPFYDADTGMVWLCGKGDSIVRFYEVTDEAPFVHFLNLYQSKDPQRGIGYMPKRGLNVNSCEISRFYKLLNNGMCEVIPFTVPRKSDLFQEDLYPDTASDEPTLSAEEFMEGKKDSNPLMISLKTGYAPVKKEKMTVKTNALASVKPTHSQAATSHAPAHTNSAPAEAASSHAHAAPAGPAAPALPAGFDAQKLVKDIAELKSIVKQQDKKIVTLEKRLSQFEGGIEEITNLE